MNQKRRKNRGEEEEGEEAYNTLQDKNPSPSRQPLSSIQLHQSKSEDTGKSRSHATDEIEDGETLLHVIYYWLLEREKSDFLISIWGSSKQTYIEHTSKIAGIHNRENSPLQEIPVGRA